MERSETHANKALIYQMRYAGATMREIGENVGLSRERVRQILVQNLGSTKYPWLSTAQVCRTLKMPRKKMVSLQDQGIIKPAFDWVFDKRHYSLWSPSIPQEIKEYYLTHHCCQVCNAPLPKNRARYCSETCRHERYKYKNRTPEEKRRILEIIKRYRLRKRKATAETEAALPPAGVLVTSG